MGVTNCFPELTADSHSRGPRHGLVKLYANQPQFSLARQIVVEDETLCQMDGETYAMHVRENMPCVCFSSQAKGFLSKLDQGGEAILPDKARRRYLCEENLAVFERCRALSAQTGFSVNAIALAWLTSQPFPTFPIAGVSRMEHIDALREAGDAVLTAQQRDGLRRL